MGWLRQLFSRRRRYDELSESIREHLDEKIADLTNRGVTQEEAERTARLEFGNVTRIEESSREVWQWPALESLWTDIKFALRQLRKSPGPALVSVLSLALGIGATTAIFSIVYCVVLRPLPYAGANRMVHIDIFDRSGDRGYELVSGQQFAQLRHVKALDGAIAEDNWVMTITNESLPQAIQADQMSGNALSFLGIPPLLGREFTESDAPLGQELPLLEKSFCRATGCHRENPATRSQELYDHRRHAQTICMERRWRFLSKRCLPSVGAVGEPGVYVSDYSQVKVWCKHGGCGCRASGTL